MIVKVQKAWDRSAQAQVFFPGRDSEPIISFSIYKPVNKNWKITLNHTLNYDDIFYLNGKELEYEKSKYDNFISADDYFSIEIEGNYNVKKITDVVYKMLEDKHVQRVTFFNIFSGVTQ